jgi:hypothetical protein
VSEVDPPGDQESVSEVAATSLATGCVGVGGAVAEVSIASDGDTCGIPKRTLTTVVAAIASNTRARRFNELRF